MAKKKSKENSFRAVTLENVKSIWDAISASSWKTIAETGFPGNKWQSKTPTTLVGTCISHQEKTPSFYIDTAKHFAHCFGCGFHVSDPIRLAAMLLKQAYADAVLHLVSTYGPFRGISVRTIDSIREYQHRQQVKDAVAWALKTELLDAVTAYQDPSVDFDVSEYSYAKPTIEFLLSRGVPLEVIHVLPLGIAPPPRHYYTRLKTYSGKKHLDVVTEGQELLKSVIPVGPAGDVRHLGWLSYIYHVDHNTVGSFKFTAPDRSKNVSWVKDPQTPVGYFGLGIPLFTELLGKEPSATTEEVFALEGEFDALAVICPQIQSGDASRPAICFSGNTVLSLDALAHSGYDTVCYIGDWDNNGNEILRYKLQETRNMRFKIFEPPADFTTSGKDAHDAYMALGSKRFLEAIFDESSYTYSPQWALGITATELAGVAEDDIRKQVEIIGQYLSAIHNPIEKEEFVTLAAEQFDIAPDLIKRQSSPNTDEGFIEAVALQLESVYKFMFQEPTMSGRRVTAWNRKSKSTVSFDLSRAHQVQSILKADLGSIVDWVEDNVGIPPRLQPKYDDEGGMPKEPPSREVRQKVYFSTIENDVIPRLIQRYDLLMKSDMVIAGQGIHIPSENRMYIVNGNDVFALKDVNGTREWISLDAPQDEDYFFDTSAGRAWSTAVTSTEVLNNYENIDIAAYYKVAAEALGTGFRFQNHDLECQYLAAFMLAAPLSDMFEHVPWIFIHGPTNTGKSSLTQVLASQAIQRRAVCLMEHALSMDNFTVAGIKQLMKGSTLTLILDEFEVGLDTAARGEYKHFNSRNVLELLRGGISQGAKVTMGTSHGSPVTYTLRFPFVASGIHTFHKREDINRVNIVEMAVNDALLGQIKVTTPAQLLTAKYGAETIEHFRHTSTIATLQHADKIRAAYKEIKAEFSEGQHTAAGTQSRAREQLLPILAVMKVVGMDYQKFALAYTEVKTQQLANTIQMHEYDTIWERVFHTNVVNLPGEEEVGKTFTLSQIVQQPDLTHLINMTDTGVYYLPDDDYLAIVWPTAIAGPLFRGSKYGNANRPETLRAYISQDPRIIDGGLGSKRVDILRQLRMYAGMISWRDVSVIPAYHFRAEEKASGESAFQSDAIESRKNILLQNIKPADDDASMDKM